MMNKPLAVYSCKAVIESLNVQKITTISIDIQDADDDAKPMQSKCMHSYSNKIDTDKSVLLLTFRSSLSTFDL